MNSIGLGTDPWCNPTFTSELSLSPSKVQLNSISTYPRWAKYRQAPMKIPSYSHFLLSWICLVQLEVSMWVRRPSERIVCWASEMIWGVWGLLCFRCRDNMTNEENCRGRNPADGERCAAADYVLLNKLPLCAMKWVPFQWYCFCRLLLESVSL